jgi:hypothetical protein
MQKNQTEELVDMTKVLGFVAVLLAVIFLLPNAGHDRNQTFFAVAIHSLWGKWFEWAAMWCSAKIILLSAAILLAIDAVGTLLVRTGKELIGVVLLTSIVIPVLLFLFGAYELLKAVL